MNVNCSACVTVSGSYLTLVCPLISLEWLRKLLFNYSYSWLESIWNSNWCLKTSRCDLLALFSVPRNNKKGIKNQRSEKANLFSWYCSCLSTAFSYAVFSCYTNYLLFPLFRTRRCETIWFGRNRWEEIPNQCRQWPQSGLRFSGQWLLYLLYLCGKRQDSSVHYFIMGRFLGFEYSWEAHLIKFLHPFL